MKWTHVSIYRFSWHKKNKHIYIDNIINRKRKTKYIAEPYPRAENVVEHEGDIDATDRYGCLKNAQ